MGDHGAGMALAAGVCAIASMTAAGIRLPPRRVKVPVALMIGVTPNVS